MAWAMFRVKEPKEGAGRSPRAAPSLRTRALRMLARREHTCEELRRKLAPFATEGEDLPALLQELSAKGWLSDARYAEQAARVRGRRYGPLRIARELREKGVEESCIVQAVAASGAGAGLAQVWASRFKSAPTDQRERARQVRFLQARGFALEEILRFLKAPMESA